MDLYEALKAGTSEEELLKAFHKDLEEANARIAKEEEEAADQEYLNVCREYLAEAILDYAYALLGEELGDSCSIEYIIETLKNFEKEMKYTITFSKKLDKILKEAKNENENKKPVEIKATTCFDDDEVFARFLKTLNQK